jgi:nitrogen regulatory protein P-II 1
MVVGHVAADPPNQRGWRGSREGVMKLISGIVRPEKVDAVKAALGKVRVCAVTVAAVHDYAPQAHGTTVWRGHEHRLVFSVKHELRFVVHDEDVDDAVEAFMRTARTGEEGDGYVSVISVDHRYNIRTGSREAS